MSYSDRMNRLRQRMAETATDLVAVGPSSHMRWLAGLAPHGDERPVMILVGPRGAAMLMPALNADSQRPLTELPFFTWSDDEGPAKALAALLADIGATRSGMSVALDETMRADFALLVLAALRQPKHKFTHDTVAALRARKDEAEYRALKANALLNDGAMRAAFAALRPGVTEAEVATVVIDYYRANGASREFTSVCFGGNGAFPHHHTGETRLAADQAVLIDIGGRSQGYPSDMTRVAHLGQPGAEFTKVHEIVDRAVRAALATARPGVKAKAVDKAARDIIAAAGYGDRFLHRTGHGLGIDVHETPYITATSETVLEEGMVFSIEPGIYLPGQFGLRLEEIVILRADGPEVLSELPRTTYIAAP
ncbi:MAG TPA: Xaa-Pro peptidase family protein [Devosiaceae bacterium]|jgi:Xaa-Pro aminopeptidase|nr:Xaa-Pro peptidase family protein [Devosiaceae bacterium]